MKKIFFGIPLLCALFFTNADAQDIVTQTFYKARYGEETKDSTKARFAERTTITKDGTTYIENINLKKNNILSREIYKDGFQVGKWLDGNKEYDFDFDVAYNQTISAEIPVLDFYKGTLGGKEESSLEVIQMGNGDFYKFLSKNLRYPRIARENGIQGKIVVQFVIDETGALSQLSVVSGADPMLDKEFIRVLRLINNWKPAKLNGKPIKIQTRITTGFRIQA